MDWHQAIENEKQQISTDHFPVDFPCETRNCQIVEARLWPKIRTAKARNAGALWTPKMLHHDWGSLVHSGHRFHSPLSCGISWDV